MQKKKLVITCDQEKGRPRATIKLLWNPCDAILVNNDDARDAAVAPGADDVVVHDDYPGVGHLKRY